MPRKPKRSTPDAPLAPISSDILDQFVRAGPLTPEELRASSVQVREGADKIPELAAAMTATLAGPPPQKPL